MVELHENTNINRNEQLEHVSCSISVACLVLVQQLCKGTNSAVALSRDSGFAIQHVSTFMLTVVKNFSSPTQPALGIMS